MSRSVKTHKALLQALQTAKPSLRKAILEKADKALIFAICELCENLLIGNIKISEEQKKKLRKHRSQLRAIAQRGGGGVGYQRKKKVVLQRGGAFLPLLLSIVSSVLPALLQ